MKGNKGGRGDVPLLSRIYLVSGASATIVIISLILFALKIVPNEILIAIGFFASFPVVYSFIFGIITNRPNFQSMLRHYSLTAYLLVALVIFLIVLKPESLIEGIKFVIYFVFGLIFAVIGYFTYAVPYNLLKKYKYRWRALAGFGASFIVVLAIAFILNKYNVFEIFELLIP